MRRFVNLCAIVVLALVWLAPAAAAEKEGKTVSLFNGKDLSGWTFHLRAPDAKMEDVWSVVDGTIVCKGKPAGYIRTKAEYENYTLTLEWRWKPGSRGGNSGVLVHTSGDDKVWPKSVESQLAAGNAGDFWVIGGVTLKVTDQEKRNRGRRFLNLTDGSEKEPGQWNKKEITCRGDEIIVKVNGELVNHGTDLSVSKGTIALQSEGAEIHFRNIKLTPLKE